MNILVTGSKGFIGKNLIEKLNREENLVVYRFDADNTLNELENYIDKIDFIFHLAGVNKPKKEEEFLIINSKLTEDIINIIENKKKKIPILFSSSIQAKKDNAYGKSKLTAEKILKDYAIRNNAPIFIYQLPNVFGKWCKPNYNSVVATFCYNISREKPIKINDENVKLNLVHISNVIESFFSKLNNINYSDNFHFEVKKSYNTNLKELASLLYSFKESRKNLIMPKVNNEFIKILYSTYLSYLPKNNFSYDLNSHIDNRGSFSELFKMNNGGQFSVSTSKKGVLRGNHYHNIKTEKFIVIKGNAIARLRRIDSKEVIEYNLSDEKLVILDIPPGFTHNIENIGESEMTLLIWANELFDKDNPDTYIMEI